jgi:hypothetical protein
MVVLAFAPWQRSMLTCSSQMTHGELQSVISSPASFSSLGFGSAMCGSSSQTSGTGGIRWSRNVRILRTQGHAGLQICTERCAAGKTRTPMALIMQCTGMAGIACSFAKLLTCSHALLPADTRNSAIWLAVYTAAFLPWLLVYTVGGAKVLGQTVYSALNINSLDLAAMGFGRAP